MKCEVDSFLILWFLFVHIFYPFGAYLATQRMTLYAYWRFLDYMVSWIPLLLCMTSMYTSCCFMISLVPTSLSILFLKVCHGHLFFIFFIVNPQVSYLVFLTLPCIVFSLSSFIIISYITYIMSDIIPVRGWLVYDYLLPNRVLFWIKIVWSK